MWRIYISELTNRTGPINGLSVLFQVMAWRLAGDKPLHETMLKHFINTRIRITAPEFVINQGLFIVALSMA